VIEQAAFVPLSMQAPRIHEISRRLCFRSIKWSQTHTCTQQQPAAKVKEINCQLVRPRANNLRCMKPYLQPSCSKLSQRQAAFEPLEVTATAASLATTHSRTQRPQVSKLEAKQRVRSAGASNPVSHGRRAVPSPLDATVRSSCAHSPARRSPARSLHRTERATKRPTQDESDNKKN